MASPKASGRMIRTSVSESEGIARLSPEAAMLFFMLIPHFNCHGKMAAGPGIVKDIVVPLIAYLTYDNLPQYLQEISDKTNVKWFRQDGKWWLHSLHFLTEHQDLRPDKMGKDSLPSYPDPVESGSSPGVLPELPLRAEGFKVLRLEEEPLKPQQQHAGAREQLAEVIETRLPDLQRLFPDADIPVVSEKLLHHFRARERLTDPWMTAVKWFQGEFKATPQAASRASPLSYAEKWRKDAAAEGEAFVCGGSHDEDIGQQGGSVALPEGYGGALQGAHAAG